jgi:TPP-dependent pyruvate/acetoin dehydrogenase alpha subunit
MVTTKPSLVDAPREVLLSMFEIITKISITDARIRKGLTSGEFQFTYYNVRGQEAIPAGVSTALRPDDHMVTTYRCLHDIIAKGVPLREILAEMMGRATGTSKGKGGPMHISDPKSGLMVTTGVVGGGIPIANGLALASKMKNTGQVAVTNFGDGATSIGASHEAFNMAALWDLPVIFVCQNNQFGEHTVQAEYTKTQSLADRAAAYGMRGVRVDGNDPVAVYTAAREAVAQARAGGGPTLLECVTYRLMGHAFGADTAYMEAYGLNEAWERDPVPAYRHRLLEDGVVSEEELQTIEADVTELVEDAVRFAQSSPPPGPAELLIDVFANVESVPK